MTDNAYYSVRYCVYGECWTVNAGTAPTPDENKDSMDQLTKAILKVSPNAKIYLIAPWALPELNIFYVKMQSDIILL